MGGILEEVSRALFRGNFLRVRVNFLSGKCPGGIVWVGCPDPDAGL